VGEKNSKGWVTDNRCEVCRFFSGEASDWPTYKPDATKAASSFLSVLFKDAKAAVKMLEDTLLRLSEWAFECSDTVSVAVNGILVARSAIISFFIDSMTSYNPDALRGDKEHGRDAINAKWSQTDCIAQLALHCMNIRFSGSQKICMRPLAKLVDNLSFVVRVIQQRFDPTVEELCKTILSMPDGQILKTSLRAVMPEVNESISDIMLRHRHLMVSSAMHASALFLLESGMFPPKSLTRPVGSHNRHHHRHYRRNTPKFSRFHEFVASCHASHNGCTPLHVLLALSFNLPASRLSLIFQCEDDLGITAIAHSLIVKLTASSSPFLPQGAVETNASAVLSNSALKRLIVMSLSDSAKQKDASSTDAFGSGTVEDDVADVQETRAQSSDDDDDSSQGSGNSTSPAGSGDEADNEGQELHHDPNAARIRCVSAAQRLHCGVLPDVVRFNFSRF